MAESFSRLHPRGAVRTVPPASGNAGRKHGNGASRRCENAAVSKADKKTIDGGSPIVFRVPRNTIHSCKTQKLPGRGHKEEQAR